VKETSRNRALQLLGALALLAAGPAGADTFYVDRFDDSTANTCNLIIPNDCGLRARSSGPTPPRRRRRPAPGRELQPHHPRRGRERLPDRRPRRDRHGPDRRPRPGLTTVDAGGVADRVFDVLATGERLTLRGLTLTGGACAAGEDGGAIRAAGGSLRLETCAVSGNRAQDFGMAVISSTSAVPGDVTEIVDSWITGNTAHYAILHVVTADIERTTVSGNTLAYYAGTVEIYGDGSVLVDSTFEGSGGSTGDPSVLIWAAGVAIEGCTLVGNEGHRSRSPPPRARPSATPCSQAGAASRAS